MRDKIPLELLVFVGENDSKLSEEDHGVFFTYLLNKREASKAVIKNRINKLSCRYGTEVGDIKAITIKNKDITLELPSIEVKEMANYDSFPIIIHTTDLDEYKNYKFAIQISRYWFIDLITKIRTINSGKLSGTFLVEFRFGSPNFLSTLDVLEDEEVKTDIEIGKMLVTAEWINNITPGHWGIFKNRGSWLDKRICLGKYNCIVSPMGCVSMVSPFSYMGGLKRIDCFLFKDASYIHEYDNLSQLIFNNLKEILDFGYWNCKTVDEIKKYPGIDMGEITVSNSGLLSKILKERPSELWDTCLESSEYINLVPPEEVRTRKDKLIYLMKKDHKNSKLIVDEEFLSNRLINLFGFSEIEANEIINEVL